MPCPTLFSRKGGTLYLQTPPPSLLCIAICMSRESECASCVTFRSNNSEPPKKNKTMHHKWIARCLVLLPSEVDKMLHKMLQSCVCEKLFHFKCYFLQQGELFPRIDSPALGVRHLWPAEVFLVGTSQTHIPQLTGDNWIRHWRSRTGRRPTPETPSSCCRPTWWELFTWPVKKARSGWSSHGCRLSGSTRPLLYHPACCPPCTVAVVLGFCGRISSVLFYGHRKISFQAARLKAKHP